MSSRDEAIAALGWLRVRDGHRWGSEQLYDDAVPQQRFWND